MFDKDKSKEYQRLYHLRTWEKRKTRHKQLKQKRERKLVKWLIAYKKGVVCEICGESYSGCLDFHHTDANDKINAISDLVSKGYGLKTIINEINKCRVLCKNCHVKIHDNIIT